MTKQKKTSRVRRLASYLLRGVLLLVGLLLLAIVFFGLTEKGPGAEQTPAGYTRNESQYITMDDGTQIAVDIWYPAELAPGEEVPAIMLSTRYWRVQQPGFLSRALMGLGLIEGVNYSVRDAFDEAGYAYVLVDARGSGASSGRRTIEWSPDEISDMGQVVDWIVAQPWSDGRVGGYGVSYDGNTAELLATVGRPAVKAVAPLYDRFDPVLGLVRPGGVLNQAFVEDWGQSNAVRDAGQLCPPEAERSLNCLLLKALIDPLKPVDADEDGQQLAGILAERDNPFDVTQAVGGLTYVDDELASGFAPADVSPYGFQAALEEASIPMLVWVGWLDAGSVNDALGRYMSVDVPQQLVIGPWSHGGGDDADPFQPEETPVDPPEAEQTQMLVDFFDAQLIEGAPLESSIRYYTQGAGQWHTAATWPPTGATMQRYYFGPDGSLTAEAPLETGAADAYAVDFTASTGEDSRWHTPLGGDVIYPDRAEEDQKLLTYTTPPLPADAEITGNPIVTLYVASTADDGAFHVYLEDVAPDGRATYITEGIMHALHRQVSDEAPPYAVFGPYHTFERADGALLVPGEVTEISFALFATSAVIEAGHQIRVAIAGHDAGAFERIPAEGEVTISVQRNPASASFIELPLMERGS